LKFQKHKRATVIGAKFTLAPYITKETNLDKDKLVAERLLNALADGIIKQLDCISKSNCPNETDGTESYEIEVMVANLSAYKDTIARVKATLNEANVNPKVTDLILKLLLDLPQG